VNSKKHLTKTQKQEILNKLQQDYSVSAVCRDLKIGCSRVKRFVAETDISYTPNQCHKGEITREFANWFVINSPANNSAIRKAIISHDIIPHQYCANCNCSNIWCGKPLILELHHINGINTDNSIANLVFLCPNCHSQTSTFRSRNGNSKKVEDDQFIKALQDEPNISRALRRVGLTPKGSNYVRAYKLINKHNITKIPGL